MNRFATTFLAILASVACTLGAEPKATDPSRLKAEMVLLDDFEAGILKHADSDDDYIPKASRDLAEKGGLPLIHFIMQRARSWHGEEGIPYVLVIAFLPRASALKILKQYESSDNEAVRAYAHDFQFDIADDSLKPILRKYARKQK